MAEHLVNGENLHLLAGFSPTKKQTKRGFFSVHSKEFWKGSFNSTKAETTMTHGNPSPPAESLVTNEQTGSKFFVTGSNGLGELNSETITTMVNENSNSPVKSLSTKEKTEDRCSAVGSNRLGKKGLKSSKAEITMTQKNLDSPAKSYATDEEAKNKFLATDSQNLGKGSASLIEADNAIAHEKSYSPCQSLATTTQTKAEFLNIGSEGTGEPLPKRMKMEIDMPQEKTETSVSQETSDSAQPLMVEDQTKTGIASLALEVRWELYGLLITSQHQPLQLHPTGLRNSNGRILTICPAYGYLLDFDFRSQLSHTMARGLLFSNRQFFIEAKEFLYERATRRFWVGGRYTPEPIEFSWGRHRQLAYRIELLVEDTHRSGDRLDIEFRNFCKSLWLCMTRLGPEFRLKKLTVHHDVHSHGIGDGAPDYLEALKLLVPYVNEVAIGYLLTHAGGKNQQVYRAIKDAMAGVPKWSFPITGYEYED